MTPPVPPRGGSPAAGGLSSALANASQQVPPLMAHEEIALRFLYRRNDGNEETIETIQAFADQTIRDIKLKLHSNKGWFNDRHVLVCGGRELHDNEIVGQVARAAKHDKAHLHLLVRPQDIIGGHIVTDKQTVFFGDSRAQPALEMPPGLGFPIDAPAAALPNPRAPSGGLRRAVELEVVTAADGTTEDGWEADDAIRPVPSSSSLAIVNGNGTPPPRPTALARGDDMSLLPNTFLHLMWPRASAMSMQATKSSSLELSVTHHDTAESVRRKLTVASGKAQGGSRGAAAPAGPPHAASLPSRVSPVGSGAATPTSGSDVAPASLYDYTAHRRQSRTSQRPGPALSDFLVPVGDQQCAPVGTPPLSCPNHALNRKFLDAQLGLSVGYDPELAAVGTGGSYFLRGANGDRVAVFKPEDEEPAAPNNPKGSPQRSGSTAPGTGSSDLRRGTIPGEGAVREVAAYLLDHGGFAGVPATALVSYCKHDPSGVQQEVKRGSLQEFVTSEGDCEEYGYSNIPVHEVHKIAVLDLRLANADRNGGNILRRRTASGEIELVPIDHGYCLPASFEDISFEWLWWPQAEVPFSPATRHFIAALDANKDLKLLAQAGLSLRPDCQRVFKVCTAWLKKAAAAGLSPHQIGAFLSRDNVRRSEMEKLVRAATDAVRAAAAAGGDVAPGEPAGGRWNTVPEDQFLAAAERLMDEWLVMNGTSTESTASPASSEAQAPTLPSSP